MAQEISRTKHWSFTSAVENFLFGAMRDNGDDAFGEPLSRVDRPVHISTPLPSPVSSTLMTNPISPTIGSSSSTSTPLDLFNVLWTPAYPKRLWLPISILSQTNVRHLANHPLVMNSSHSKSLIDQLVRRLTYIFREIPCLRLPLSLFRSIDLVSWQTPGKLRINAFYLKRKRLITAICHFP